MEHSSPARRCRLIEERKDGRCERRCDAHRVMSDAREDGESRPRASEPSIRRLACRAQQPEDLHRMCRRKMSASPPRSSCAPESGDVFRKSKSSAMLSPIFRSRRGQSSISARGARTARTSASASCPRRLQRSPVPAARGCPDRTRALKGGDDHKIADELGWRSAMKNATPRRARDHDVGRSSFRCLMSAAIRQPSFRTEGRSSRPSGRAPADRRRSPAALRERRKVWAEQLDRAEATV